MVLLSTISTKVHKIYSDFLAVESIDPTLAYVQYMKFCRRAEGIKVRKKRTCG